MKLRFGEASRISSRNSVINPGSPGRIPSGVPPGAPQLKHTQMRGLMECTFGLLYGISLGSFLGMPWGPDYSPLSFPYNIILTGFTTYYHFITYMGVPSDHYLPLILYFPLFASIYGAIHDIYEAFRGELG
jgi:hypothetical protein